MAPRSNLYRTADQVFDGELPARLAEWREAKKSYGEISALLREAGVFVTDETVRVWCMALEVGDDGATAATA